MLRNIAPPLLHASSANKLPSPRNLESYLRLRSSSGSSPRSSPQMHARPTERPECVNDGARARQ